MSKGVDNEKDIDMPAGDIHLKIEEIRLIPGRRATIEYKYGIEDKKGAVDYRGDMIEMPWADFKAALSAEDRLSLRNLRIKAKELIVASNPTRWTDAIEDPVQD